VTEDRYRITTGDGRSTEELVQAGAYGYVHSCLTSENFPARHFEGRRVREIVLLRFGRPVTAAEAIGEALAVGLVPPVYEDALYFGIAHPDAQRDGPIVFLHDPWVGHFGRRDVVCLWTNAGRREIGLDGFDDQWAASYRFGFVEVTARRRRRGPGSPGESRGRGPSRS
jgi:hypothetical protein